MPFHFLLTGQLNRAVKNTAIISILCQIFIIRKLSIHYFRKELIIVINVTNMDFFTQCQFFKYTHINERSEYEYLDSVFEFVNNYYCNLKPHYFISKLLLKINIFF